MMKCVSVSVSGLAMHKDENGPMGTDKAKYSRSTNSDWDPYFLWSFCVSLGLLIRITVEFAFVTHCCCFASLLLCFFFCFSGCL